MRTVYSDPQLHFVSLRHWPLGTGLAEVVVLVIGVGRFIRPESETESRYE